MSGAGASIDVLNDAGEPASDSYGIVAVTPTVTGKTLAGRQIDVFQFALVDLDSTMFSDVSLPTSADFAASADFSQNLILLEEELGGTLLFSEGAFQFSAYDPAGTIAAIQADLAGLTLLRLPPAEHEDRAQSAAFQHPQPRSNFGEFL